MGNSSAAFSQVDADGAYEGGGVRGVQHSQSYNDVSSQGHQISSAGQSVGPPRSNQTSSRSSSQSDGRHSYPLAQAWETQGPHSRWVKLKLSLVKEGVVTLMTVLQENKLPNYTNLET